MPADVQPLAVAYASVAVGQGRDHAAETAEALAVSLQGRPVPSGAPVERQRLLWRRACAIAGQQAALQVLQARHPQATAGVPGQPAGHSDMVRMKMGSDDPAQGGLA
ncbi:hypothetical protein D3C76_1147950 [compost metagenome]